MNKPNQNLIKYKSRIRSRTYFSKKNIKKASLILEVIENLTSIMFDNNNYKTNNLGSIIRIRYLEFLTYVVKAFGYSRKTIFLAIGLMDKYLKKENEAKPYSIRVFLISCAFIASKYLEKRNHLLLKNLEKHLLQEKFSR